MDSRSFAIDRFSRLYPLFLATLLWAWGGHNLYAFMNQGPNWNPGANDVVGLLRQIFVFPLWTPTRVIGFNLPSWSLPVEALMYIIFFVFARRHLLSALGTLLMVLLAIPVNLYSSDIGWGMSCFFMGGLCHFAYERFSSARIEQPLRIVLTVSWPLVVIFGCGLIDLAKTRLAFLDHYYATYVLFPATVLYVAAHERRTGAIARRLAWFGDSTYAMYLLHFPMMLTTAIAFRWAGWDFALLRRPEALVLFVAVLIPLSVCCHRFFERPMQDWIRRRALPRTTSTRLGESSAKAQ